MCQNYKIRYCLSFRLSDEWQSRINQPVVTKDVDKVFGQSILGNISWPKSREEFGIYCWDWTCAFILNRVWYGRHSTAWIFPKLEDHGRGKLDLTRRWRLPDPGRVTLQVWRQKKGQDGRLGLWMDYGFPKKIIIRELGFPHVMTNMGRSAAQ